MLSRKPRNGPRLPTPVRSSRMENGRWCSDHWWTAVLPVMCSHGAHQPCRREGDGARGSSAWSMLAPDTTCARCRCSRVVSQRLGRVFVSSARPPGGDTHTGREGNGSAHVLIGRSGAIVRTLPVGRLPGPMAVDERERYLVVLNLNGSDLDPGPWAWIPAWLRRRLPFLSNTLAT